MMEAALCRGSETRPPGPPDSNDSAVEEAAWDTEGVPTVIFSIQEIFMKSIRSRHALGWSVAVVSVLALGACSADGADPADPDALRSVRVVMGPIQFEPLNIAVERGYFEEQGLDVEIVPGPNPAANLAQVISGDADITSSSWATIATSVSQGVNVSLIGGNGTVSPTAQNSGIVVNPDGPIESVADLEGKTVALIGLNTGTEIPLLLAAQDAGIDPESLSLVAIPYSGMQAAVENNQVDAAFPADAFYQQMISAGLVSISHPVQEYQAGLPVTVWAVTDEWLAANPDVAESYIAAMRKAVDFYNDPANLDAVHEVTARVNQVDVSTLSSTLTPMRVPLNITAGQRSLDALFQFGYLDRELTTDDFIWERAETFTESD